MHLLKKQLAKIHVVHYRNCLKNTLQYVKIFLKIDGEMRSQMIF